MFVGARVNTFLVNIFNLTLFQVSSDMSGKESSGGHMVCVLKGRVYAIVFFSFCLILVVHLFTMFVFIQQGMDNGQFVKRLERLVEQSTEDSSNREQGRDVNIQTRGHVPLIKSHILIKNTTTQWEVNNKNREEIDAVVSDTQNAWYIVKPISTIQQKK